MSARVHCPSIIILFIHFPLQNFRLCSLTLFAVKTVLRTLLVKFSLACANWRAILSNTACQCQLSVPCDLFLLATLLFL